MLILNPLLIEALSSYDDETLTEAKISVMKRGIGSKRAALAGSTAMQIAKKKNPAMYKMYRFF